MMKAMDSSVAVATRTDFTKCKVAYPLGGIKRDAFRTKSGKKLSEKQWAVYDYVRKIPCGKVTTYKHVCLALGFGSPRSVGAAMRNNPFAPFVPCHRVVASNFYIGGFFGEWGSTKEDGSAGQQCKRKLDMLTQEGVTFTNNGYLSDPEAFIWKE
ncbi:hypothetical protein NLI96_g2606 [Meripilus lineatus]|uniref:Methylated-DNA--protein-cysteine methyltransferase n=1 Tax=Meripilus lineatus TaxID=2056292 RepID=A0AAD5V8H5_9APHY|nr:hypothetical protein NLI96_g2606 [Physisporinus lineatus]